MQELNQLEISTVNGGEAGVPHTDYYYGPGKTAWERFVDDVLDLICRDGARC